MKQKEACHAMTFISCCVWSTYMIIIYIIVTNKKSSNNRKKSYDFLCTAFYSQNNYCKEGFYRLKGGQRWYFRTGNGRKIDSWNWVGTKYGTELIFKAGINFTLKISSPPFPRIDSTTKLILTRNRFCGIDARGPWKLKKSGLWSLRRIWLQTRPQQK